MTRAYYNEIDPYAAQWLRNLMAAGHITAGEVDERSIVDVRPSELAGFDRCHFFAGIGVWDYALGLAGWPAELPVWTGSCPCQPLSKAGLRRGADDERHLWPTWRDLVAECRPHRILGEQVAAGLGLEWIDAVYSDLERLGYTTGAVITPAAGFGAEHIRDRLWFVADASSEGPSRPILKRDGSPSLVLSKELQRSDNSIPARLHPRSDRATIRPLDGSARCVGAVRAFGNAINAEAAKAFIQAVRECLP